MVFLRTFELERPGRLRRIFLRARTLDRSPFWDAVPRGNFNWRLFWEFVRLNEYSPIAAPQQPHSSLSMRWRRSTDCQEPSHRAEEKPWKGQTLLSPRRPAE